MESETIDKRGRASRRGVGCLNRGLWIICACVALLPFTWSSLNDMITHIRNSSNGYEFSMYYLGT